MTSKHTRPAVAADPNSATGQWLRRTRITDDPADDTIADMCRDPSVPTLFRNIKTMRDYLQSKGACQEAMETVPTVWQRYRNWLDRNPCRSPPTPKN
jgi:hypothetical protein